MASKLYGLMALAGASGGMSAWQFHRFFWKRNLIESRTERFEEEPVAGVKLPKDPPPDVELVRVRGTFYNDAAVLVGPKKSRKTEYGKVETAESYMVFVPFITEHNDHVMVCKGQVPSSAVADGKLLKSILQSWPTNAEITCVYRKPAPVPSYDIAKRTEDLYKHPHPGMMWTDFYDRYDIKEGARMPKGYWLDVVDHPFETTDGYPLTRARESYIPHIISPPVHAVYFVTWTALFFIATYNIQRHGARLYCRGLATREQYLGGLKHEGEMKW